jgi:hypothetical protein
MIDVSTLQQMSYLVAAIGVIAAATYYVLVLRATYKNRRIQLVSQLARDLGTVDGMRQHFELLNMEWDNYHDFEKKYGSDTNLDTASIRYSVWNTYKSLGYMLRMGMIDSKDIWGTSSLGVGAIYQWAKWKPIIEEQRKQYNGSNWMNDFEYLAGEMLKIMVHEDPSFKVPETFARYIPDN